MPPTLPSGPENRPADQSFEHRVADYRNRVDQFIAANLTRAPSSATLNDAIRYAVTGAGKRVRPLLTYATGEVIGCPADRLNYPAAAIEMIHTYSLVHDDLPAMDDDDLRRGRPTVHRKFDEATAILVGDGLQSLAFSVLSTAPVDPEIRAKWCEILARSAGPAGMVGGQALDMEGENRQFDLVELEQMHNSKTGALITAGILLAAAARPDLETRSKTDLRSFGDNIGLAFQIRDDVLDVESTTEKLGKPQGSDQDQHKSTFVSLLGLDEAKRRTDLAYQAACDSLSRFGAKAEPLLWLATYIVKRDH